MNERLYPTFLCSVLLGAFACGEGPSPPAPSPADGGEPAPASDAGERPRWTYVSVGRVPVVCAVDHRSRSRCWGRLEGLSHALSLAEGRDTFAVRLPFGDWVWRQSRDGRIDETLFFSEDGERVPFALEYPDAPALVAFANSYFSCAWFGEDDLRCPRNAEESFVEVGLPSGSGVKDIAAGREVACYLNLENDLSCWTTAPLPHRLVLPELSNIEFAPSFYCGVRADDETALCWTLAQAPSLDLLPEALRGEPVSGLWASEHGVCAVRARDQRLSCFGGPWSPWIDRDTREPIEEVLSVGRPVLMADRGHWADSPACVLFADGEIECFGGEAPEALEVPALEGGP